MKLSAPSFGVLLVTVPAIAMPAVLVAFSAWVLTHPPHRTPPPAPDTAPPVERLYVPLPVPITVTLTNLGVVRIGLGVVLDKSMGAAMLTTLADKAEQLQATLVETVMALADNLGASLSAQTLRTAMPEALRIEMNNQLARMGADPLVQEVLITDWALVR